VIIRLGPPSNILTGFDIDTANFTGNEGPAADVWGLKLEGDEKEVERQEKGLLGDDPRVSWRCFRSLCIGNNGQG
jgi:allantoicase